MRKISDSLGSLGSLFGFKRKEPTPEELPESQQSLEDIVMLFLTYREVYRYLKHELKWSDEALEPHRVTYLILKQELRLRVKLMRQLVIEGVESMKDIPIEEFGLKGVKPDV